MHIRLSHVPNSSSNPTLVILVTLYRPRKHNAFTEIMTTELVDVSASFQPMIVSEPLSSLDTPRCSVLVLTWTRDLERVLKTQYGTTTMEEVGFPF
jgi:hypothetical protein